MTPPTALAVDGSPNVLLAENMVEAENSRDYNRLFSVMAPDVVLHPGGHQGLPALRATLSAFFAAFPDHHRTVMRWLSTGDTVVVHWRLTGTHLGSWG
ncbi:MAG: ester cyclase, partial [Acidimicrobiales bacterium]